MRQIELGQENRRGKQWFDMARSGESARQGQTVRPTTFYGNRSLPTRVHRRDTTRPGAFFLATEYLPSSPPSMLEAVSRGGFPESALAANGMASYRWREAFLRSIVERDLPLLGFRVNPVAMERFLSMCAHLQGQVLNAAKLGASLDLSGPTVRARLNFLQEALFVRLLHPWDGNLKKRLVRSPKLYIRDSGLCHALLAVASVEDLLGHPVFGSSWEAFCIETICASMPRQRTFPPNTAMPFRSSTATGHSRAGSRPVASGNVSSL